MSGPVMKPPPRRQVRGRKRYSIVINTGEKKLQANHVKLMMPKLSELIPSVTKALSENFKNVEVKVVDCPDLTTWCGLAEKGLGGKTRLCDLGGVPYMMDPQYHHITYQLPDVVKACEMGVYALVIGAGAASPLVVGKNAELIPNTMIPGPRHTRFAKIDFPPKDDEKDESMDDDDAGETPTPSELVIKQTPSETTGYEEPAPVAHTRSPSYTGTPVEVDAPPPGDVSSPRAGLKGKEVSAEKEVDEKAADDGSGGGDAKEIQVPLVGQYPSEETGCLANLFMSQGKPGPVLYVKVSVRTGKKNFTNTIRDGLANVTGVGGDKQIGMGGVFKVNKGKVKAHIMPDFNKKKMEIDSKEVNEWLKFYEMGPELLNFSCLLTDDPTPDKRLHLRLEHTHFYGIGKNVNEAGHYHCDVSADTIEYEGYFSLAEYIYRVEDATYEVELKKKVKEEAKK